MDLVYCNMSAGGVSHKKMTTQRAGVGGAVVWSLLDFRSFSFFLIVEIFQKYFIWALVPILNSAPFSCIIYP